MGHNHCSKFKY